MASVSISQTIVFITALVAAVGVATTLSVSVLDINNTLSEQGLAVADDIQTDVTIVSDPGSPDSIYDGGTVTLLVRNDGTRDLRPTAAQIAVLLDGEYADGVTVTELGETDETWAPGEVVRITFDRTLDSGTHRVVVSLRGDEETMSFWVPA